LETPVEFGVLSSPSATEQGIGLEFRNAVLGPGNPAVELLDGRLPVGGPGALGPRLGPGG
jgi:hypothetical protein